jgi:hypothetical protein
MEIIRTFVCPGEYDSKTKQIINMHGGWQSTKETAHCKRCGKEAVCRPEENYRSISLGSDIRMSTR